MSLRRLAKNIVFGACQYLGVNSVSRTRVLRGRALILCYHGVILRHQPDPFGYGNTVSIREFRSHLDFLARSFSPVSSAELLRWRAGSLALPRTPVLVTFDDGYRNNLTLAAEALRAKGIPAVFHIATEYIGAKRILWTDEIVYRILDWPLASAPLPDGGDERLPQDRKARRPLAVRIRNRCKRLPIEQVDAYLATLRAVEVRPPDNEELLGFMNWDEVRALHRQGFEIGAHTLTHPILTRISADRLEHELRASKQRIQEELEAQCVCIAYPNGGPEDVSPVVFESARNAGYRLGFTVAERHSDRSEDPLALSRFCVQGHLPVSSFEWRASGVQLLYRAAS